MLSLRDMEDQNADGLLILRNMWKHFQELGDAYMLKEALRNIYAKAKKSVSRKSGIQAMGDACHPDRKQRIGRDG